MSRNAFRNGASLFRVIENSPIQHLQKFLLQPDPNFRTIREGTESVFATAADEAAIRSRLLADLNAMSRYKTDPVEAECTRVLSLSETKGPTSLQVIVDRQLDHEACQQFEDQPGDLAKSLWAHVRHRREFDNAISFKNVRSWRDAGRLFAAFNVDLDGKGDRFIIDQIDTEKLIAAIGKKMKSDRPLTISLIDLPSAEQYLPSVLVIVRFAGQQTSIATHGEQGERLLVYLLPQEEAVLIYTPADERIEVAATRAAIRNAVAECFAEATLGHDVSKKPLTSAEYETRRFLTSMDLPHQNVVGFTMLAAKVAELELRAENWQSRLSLKALGSTEMGTLVERYLEPAKVLRRALGVSRVMIAISYERAGDNVGKVLEIMISDRNNSSLNSERDPVVRNFGRKLLEAWGILRPFRDLDPSEAFDLLPIMAELWELNSNSQKSVHFTERGIAPKRLEEAKLIKCREIEPMLIEEEEDPNVEGPSTADRMIYSVDLDWMQERLITALKAAVDVASAQVIAPGLCHLGVMLIDDREIPCYLARGLSDMKAFIEFDERLRARSGSGPGIVFTGQSGGPSFVGAHVVIPLVALSAGEAEIAADRNAIVRAFRAGRSLALGAETLELVEEESGEAARLHLPGFPSLDIFGEHPVRAFRLLVAAAKAGKPGVRAGELINGSGSSGFQQMISAKRWKIVSSYVEPCDARRWKLKGF